MLHLKMSLFILCFLFILINISNAENFDLKIKNLPYYIDVYPKETKIIPFDIKNEGDANLNKIELKIDNLPVMKFKLIPSKISVLNSGSVMTISLECTSLKEEYFNKKEINPYLFVSSKNNQITRKLNIVLLPNKYFWLIIITIFVFLLLCCFIIIFKYLNYIEKKGNKND